MKLILKCLVLLLGLNIGLNVEARPSCNDLDLKPISVHQSIPRLTKLKDSVWVFHNKSHLKVSLNRVLLKNPGLQAGWGSELQPGRWSVLVLNQPEFRLSCRSRSNSSCRHVLEIYRLNLLKPPRAGFDSSYWLLENQSCAALKKAFQEE